MAEKHFVKLIGAVIIAGAVIFGFESRTPAQEAQPQITSDALPKEQESKTAAVLDTSGRFRIFLEGAYGAGFGSADLGVTTAGDKVSISGGGGIGLGAGLGYGISKVFDLELGLGFQESLMAPSVANADGLFTRSCLLATVKSKFPTSGTGQFKAGIGIGVYSDGELDVDTTDAGGSHTVVKYDRTVGFHVTGEFERFMTRNTALSLGGKLYFVKYEANSAQVGGSPAPASSLKNDIRELDGSGLDLTIRISRYF